MLRNMLKLTRHRHRKNRIITSAWDKGNEMAISLSWEVTFIACSFNEDCTVNRYI
jgi:hypothetical protein